MTEEEKKARFELQDKITGIFKNASNGMIELGQYNHSLNIMRLYQEWQKDFKPIEEKTGVINPKNVSTL